MASDEIETFRRLLESLQPYPQMQFLLFAEKWGAPEEELLDFCRQEGHSIQLYALGDLAQRAPEAPEIRLRPYRVDQPRYNLQGRLYNHAFITAIPPEEPIAFARKVYTGLVNAGSFYLFCSPAEAPGWQEALEAANYVAGSLIELSPQRCIVSARKMHGWGG
ncbi:hypothetical protein [Nitratifractor salsuginis]|uniref:Uncharacterized protein n=1 Tax=Nitratifractor salsuginis (strain DSM 16511 / JCM 12458 / E9I37-1) TaxID=749222 RepID=E6WXX2_NITSE|nr:hypothetical protein [Nitratifractor salsuginis]ADV45293.1 hypothetical protein Nitsa_0019 [Nitratifractor salsuginis DSM 16511]